MWWAKEPGVWTCIAAGDMCYSQAEVWLWHLSWGLVVVTVAARLHNGYERLKGCCATAYIGKDVFVAAGGEAVLRNNCSK
jgi:hypothetical protein